MVCKNCGSKYLTDCEGEWQGEVEGKGGVILITSAECLDCGSITQYPEPVELVGM